MAYGDFKDLYRKTLSDKVLSDKAFNVAKDPKYDGYKCVLASLVYKFFDKRTSGSGIRHENISNKELIEELHKVHSTLNFYWQYLGCRFSRYKISK